MEDRAINADCGEWAYQYAIPVEIDAFYDGFWLRNTADDVPSVRGEQIGTPQRVNAAGLRSERGPRGIGRTKHHRGDQTDERAGQE